jgi:type IV pilus assembly protein PilY1
VGFGTGKMYLTADLATTNQQSIYGIWDNGNAAPAGSLQTQTITNSFLGTDKGAATLFRVLSNNPVCYTDAEFSASQLNTDTSKRCTRKVRGWVLNLPDSGERVIYNPSFDGTGGEIFPTYVPPTDTCVNKGVSWLMRVDGVTGGQLNGGQLNWDTNGDGNIGGTLAANVTTADKQSDGIRLDGVVPGGTVITVGGGTGGAGGSPTPVCKLLTNPTAIALNCNLKDLGRVNWRELTPVR